MHCSSPSRHPERVRALCGPIRGKRVAIVVTLLGNKTRRPKAPHGDAPGCDLFYIARFRLASTPPSERGALPNSLPAFTLELHTCSHDEEEGCSWKKKGTIPEEGRTSRTKSGDFFWQICQMSRNICCFLCLDRGRPPFGVCPHWSPQGNRARKFFKLFGTFWHFYEVDVVRICLVRLGQVSPC